MARLEDVELMLLGIPPSELARMSLQARYDLLEIAATKRALENGQMPGG